MLPDPTSPGAEDTSRHLDLRRLRRPLAGLAVAVAALGAVGQAGGSVLAGRLAEGPTGALVALLALAVVGGALLDTAGRVAWAVVVDRAEGRLRADLVTAALAQPLSALSEQAVGEVLDRVDDDTHEIGTLLRNQAWEALRTALVAVPLWVVAGVTWWPMWLLFPVFAAVAMAGVRRLLPEIRRRRVVEEMAWTDHAAAMEEGVAGRDDLRTSLGRPHLLRRTGELAARVHARFDEVLRVEVRVTRRASGVLHLLLVVVVVLGVALVAGGDLGIGALVTLFLVTSTFVGQVARLAEQLPDLQAGLGAVVRLRQLLEAPAEPAGGLPLPDGPLDLELRDLHFAYPGAPAGGFALDGVDLRLRAGRTLAVVGRTGSGKSTLVSLLSRAVDPAPGAVLLGGRDVLDVDLDELRRAVGVVSQRTEILAASLADNVALLGDVGRDRVEGAVAELGLQHWVAGLPEGLDTPLGPGGVTLSAGEEQLVAFARLLVRDVRLVVLDEATARMDPHTEAQVVRAADRLLAGRTGVLVAHRLSTIARADDVVVLESGRVAQQGTRRDLAQAPGPLRDLLDAAGFPAGFGAEVEAPAAPVSPTGGPVEVGGSRRTTTPPDRPGPGPGPSLTRLTLRVLAIHPWWGLACAGLFLVQAVLGAFGAVTAFAWGRTVQDLESGAGVPWHWVVLVGLSLLAAPLVLAQAIRGYPRWWIAVMLRVRTTVLAGQTDQRRLPRTPPGEIVARAMDSDRLARYADRWVDVTNGLLVAVLTAALGLDVWAGLVLVAVMAVSAVASVLGAPRAGRASSTASGSRARFGRSLVSCLDSVRTLKLAAATGDARRHLAAVDGGRVDAAVREHRVLALLEGVPVVMVQVGVVVAWGVLLAGGWDLATALLVSSVVSGFGWFGQVAARAITEAPGVRDWAQVTARLAGGGDLMRLPDHVDLVTGLAPLPDRAPTEPLRSLDLHGVAAVHDDGTLGVEAVDLRLQRGDLVLVVGQVGSGKSSLLGALAGLVEHRGTICWNGTAVTDPETYLRPGRVAHVAQVPRVLSGSFGDNVLLDHADRSLHPAVDDARLGRDLDEAGGPDALVGHRGVRLSGGQVQRLALARALATDAELLLADDVSSALDAATEVELWQALRARGTTVLGSTSKAAALALADTAVVLVDGRVAAHGPWSDLRDDWGHLAG